MLDIDECDEHGICINSAGSYTCSCETGYNGDGFNCTGLLTNLALYNRQLDTVRQSN